MFPGCDPAGVKTSPALCLVWLIAVRTGLRALQKLPGKAVGLRNHGGEGAVMAGVMNPVCHGGSGGAETGDETLLLAGGGVQILRAGLDEHGRGQEKPGYFAQSKTGASTRSASGSSRVAGVKPERLVIGKKSETHMDPASCRRRCPRGVKASLISVDGSASTSDCPSVSSSGTAGEKLRGLAECRSSCTVCSSR